MTTAPDLDTLADLIKRQSVTSGELTRCTTFAEIALAIARHMLRGSGQFVTISIADYNDAGDFTRLRIVASANRKQSFEAENSLELGRADLGYPLDATLDEARPVLIDDVVNDSAVGETLKQWLAMLNVQSFATLPMRMSGRTFGTIGVNGTKGPLGFSEAELQIFQTLADLVAALAQVKHLTDEFARSTAISEREAHTFAALNAEMDFAEMAGVVARNMLMQPGRFLTLSRFTLSPLGDIVGWQTLASANRERAFRSEQDALVSWDSVTPPFQDTVLKGQPYVIEDVQALGVDEIGAPLYSLFEANRVRSFVNIPMLIGGQPVAVMGVMSREPNAFAHEEVNAFTNVAGQIGTLIQARTLLEDAEQAREVANNLVLASRMISSAKDYQDMAQAIIYTVARNTTAVAITLFDRVMDAQTQAESRLMVAIGTAEGPSELDRAMHFDPMPDAAQMESLWRGLPIIIADLGGSHVPFSSGTQDLLTAHGIGWCASFGLRAGDQLLGTLDLLNTENYPFTTEEKDAFTTLADQIGAAIRSRQLLDESRTTQALATQLVQTNRRISLAENYDEVAMAVIQVMPDVVQVLAIALFDQPVQINEKPGTLETQVIASRAGVTQLSVVDQVLDGSSMAEALRRLHDGELVPILGGGVQSAMLPPISLSLLQAQGVAHIAGIGLRAGTRLLGLMAMGSELPLTTSRMQQDNFRAIADQVAITIENRRLLTQTAETLNFVQTQFEATSTVYSAEYPLEILRAIYDFAGGQYNHAHLGLVEMDSQTAMLKVVAEINYNQTTVNPRTVAMTTYPAAETLVALETLYIPDVNQDHFLTDEERVRLQRQDIAGMLIVPMVAAERLIGLIVFMSPTPVTLPLNRLRALRNLADQAAVVFDNRSLLGATEEALAETRRSYEVSRAVLASQDTLDVLRALRQHLAPDASLISHMRAGYVGGSLRTLIIDYTITPDSEQVVDIPLHEMLGEDNLARLNAFWQTQGRTLGIVEDVDQPEAENHPVTAFARTRGVKSFVGIPVFDGEVVREVITVNFDHLQRIDETERRLYEAVSDQIAIILQSHRLLRDSQVSAAQLARQVRVLEAVNDLARRISQTQDEEALLDHATETVVKVLGIDHSGVVLVEPGGQFGIVRSEYPKQGVVGTRLDTLNNPLWEEMRNSGFRPVLVQKALSDPRIEPVTRKVFEDMGLHSIAVLPIVLNERIIGGLGLDMYSPDRPITPEMVEVAETIVAQVNVGLQNTRLLSDAQRRAEQLQRVTAFSQSVQATLDLATIFNIVLSESTQMLPMTQMSISLYDTTRQELRTVAQHVDGATSINLTDGDLIPMTGHVQRVWDSWEPLHIADLKSVSSDLDPGVTVRSWLLAPILSRGRILGIASAGYVRAYAYSETDVALFNQMVNQLAVAIENAEAYRQSQRLAKNESLVNDISIQLQRQLDIHSMLDVTVNELGKVLGARQARIRLGTNTPDAGGNGAEE
ncbi:MAG: GAF domain-containing protein [Anaerolineae bacterium]|nr:GAF domain-containing protein [Anaerolineae bacterium]